MFTLRNKLVVGVRACLFPCISSILSKILFNTQRHVNRVADANEDALEALYEKRLRKKFLEKQNEDRKLQVDPVDALPIKNLDGTLHYRTGIPALLPLFCLLF